MSISSKDIIKFREDIKNKKLDDYRIFLSQLSDYFLNIDSDFDPLYITEAEKTLKEIYNYNFVNSPESSKFDILLKNSFRAVRGTVSGLAKRIKSNNDNHEDFFEKAIALGEDLGNLIRLLSLTALTLIAEPSTIEFINKITSS